MDSPRFYVAASEASIHGAQAKLASDSAAEATVTFHAVAADYETANIAKKAREEEELEEARRRLDQKLQEKVRIAREEEKEKALLVTPETHTTRRVEDLATPSSTKKRRLNKSTKDLDSSDSIDEN